MKKVIFLMIGAASIFLTLPLTYGEDNATVKKEYGNVLINQEVKRLPYCQCSSDTSVGGENSFRFRVGFGAKGHNEIAFDIISHNAAEILHEGTVASSQHGIHNNLSEHTYSSYNLGANDFDIIVEELNISAEQETITSISGYINIKRDISMKPLNNDVFNKQKIYFLCQEHGDYNNSLLMYAPQVVEAAIKNSINKKSREDKVSR